MTTVATDIRSETRDGPQPYLPRRISNRVYSIRTARKLNRLNKTADPNRVKTPISKEPPPATT